MTLREDDLVIARVREALAEDPRTHLLDVVVSRTTVGISLRGPVESEERRRAAEEVAREQVPLTLRLVNETWIQRYEPPGRVERIS